MYVFLVLTRPSLTPSKHQQTHAHYTPPPTSKPPATPAPPKHLYTSGLQQKCLPQVLFAHSCLHCLPAHRHIFMYQARALLWGWVHLESCTG